MLLLPTRISHEFIWDWLPPPRHCRKMPASDRLSYGTGLAIKYLLLSKWTVSVTVAGDEVTCPTFRSGVWVLGFMSIESIMSEQTLGRVHTKETGNREATAISENCYQIDLNTWNWIEQRKLRKRQRNSRKTEKLNFPATEQASLFTVALSRSFRLSAVSNVLLWFICLFWWDERLMKLLILFLCS
jgi:hypothetical protein